MITTANLVNIHPLIFNFFSLVMRILRFPLLATFKIYDTVLSTIITILWPPHVKSWLIGKDSDAGRDWGQEEKGTREDEMAGWHHQLDGHEFEWTPGVGDGQGGLACCSSWGCKESDTTEQLNWTDVSMKEFNESVLCSSWWCAWQYSCASASRFSVKTPNASTETDIFWRRKTR